MIYLFTDNLFRNSCLHKWTDILIEHNGYTGYFCYALCSCHICPFNTISMFSVGNSIQYNTYVYQYNDAKSSIQPDTDLS